VPSFDAFEDKEALDAKLSENSQLVRKQYSYQAATSVWHELINSVAGK